MKNITILGLFMFYCDMKAKECEKLAKGGSKKHSEHYEKWAIAYRQIPSIVDSFMREYLKSANAINAVSAKIEEAKSV